MDALSVRKGKGRKKKGSDVEGDGELSKGKDGGRRKLKERSHKKKKVITTDDDSDDEVFKCS